MGRTGLYRFRRGSLGGCVLQYQSSVLRSDLEGGGHIFTWTDEKYGTLDFGHFFAKNVAQALSPMPRAR